MKFAVSNFDIVLILPTGVRTVGLDHKCYTEICKALQAGKTDEEVMALVDAKNAIVEPLNKVAPGMIEVRESEDPAADPDVFIAGAKITGRVADLILHFKKKNMPFGALKNFWKRVQANPLLVGRESMINFMTQNDVPLLPDGRFMAYKGVNKTEDPNVFRAVHDRNFIYRLGEYATEDREKCTVDVNNTCGPGLHTGGFSHASGYGDTIIDCIVDPADVTSVPQNEACKMRACRVLPLRVNNDRKPYEGEYINLRTETVENAGKEMQVAVEGKPRAKKVVVAKSSKGGGRTKKTTWYRLVGGRVVSQRKVKQPGSEWTSVRPTTTVAKPGKAGKPSKAVSKPIAKVSLKGAAKRPGRGIG